MTPAAGRAMVSGEEAGVVRNLTEIIDHRAAPAPGMGAPVAASTCPITNPGSSYTRPRRGPPAWRFPLSRIIRGDKGNVSR
jgi:hypothetical protein